MHLFDYLQGGKDKKNYKICNLYLKMKYNVATRRKKNVENMNVVTKDSFANT